MHIPVLQKEVIEYLDPKPDENFIDATLGSAGHTIAILEKNGPKGKVLGIDRDPEQIKNSKLNIKDAESRNRLIAVCDNFANLKEIAEREKIKEVSGIIFDLGMSSWHLEDSGRGFSFLKEEPLDMRYGDSSMLSAEKILNYESCQEIERILREYGEEGFSKRIAEKIIEVRKTKPIKTTYQLVDIIREAVPTGYQHQKIHYATRTFQAMRIAVNGELDSLIKVLPQAVEILKCGGKIVLISFHSLEDRIVKNFFREKARENILKIITKKPIVPTVEEIKINNRSRSAKLRAAEKTCLKRADI
ncbi:MAG: 16S rRNA (cytosine(1402)-N(4))-methyltransferase RsmH [bacterium]|nr:16S rRNA (cytosine(1402)-N(4))-methyltransferase RsmH [bacterium]